MSPRRRFRTPALLLRLWIRMTCKDQASGPEPGDPGVDRRLKLLHLMAPGGAGGLEQVVQGLTTGLAREGHDVTVGAVVSRGPGRHPMLESLSQAGVRLVPLRLPPRAYLQERADVSRLCQRLRPDVVHTHGYRPDVVVSGVARGHGIPTVTTVHGFTGGGLKNRMYQRLQIASFRRFEAVVAVSRPLQRRLVQEGIPQERVHTIQNAWSETRPLLDRRMARRRLGIPDDDFLIGWVGRLSHEKGADVLLSAVSHLTDLPLSVSIIGEGPERSFLQERVGKHDWHDRVHWHGLVPEAGRFFPAFDVFVLSSRTEGTPMVLFEAMSGIVPIVATAVGGVPDVLSNHEALLVPAGDSASLARAIRSVYHSRGAARARAHAARERLVRDFGPEPWLERYESLYHQLVHGIPKPARPVRIWSPS